MKFKNGINHTDLPSGQACGFNIINTTIDELIKSIDNDLNYETTQIISILTLNPEIAKMGLLDKEYYRILQSYKIVTCDGIGIKIASFFSRKRITYRICGSDLLIPLAKLCASRKRNFLLLGGEKEVNELAVHNLEKEIPELNAFGISPHVNENGLLNERCDKELHDLLKATQPLILASCLGAPKDNWFLYQYRDKLFDSGVRVVIGAGGTVDFLSGRVPRAPKIFRIMGLEWLFRTIAQPKRLSRLMKNVIPFFFIFLFKKT